ncbi:hypothetical protein [Streptomyces sp. NPDC003943]
MTRFLGRRRLMADAPLVLVSATACSGGSGDGATAKGRSAAEVCGGSAKSGPTQNALTALIGDDALLGDWSEPEAALKVLKEANGELSTEEMGRSTSARDLIIGADLERMNKISLSDQDIAVHQITVLNAAARTMAVKLGCQDTKLVDGVPAAVKG